MLRRRVASAAAGAVVAVAARSVDCKPLKRNGSNPNGLNDPEWYEEQNEHIKLGLPLVEEARQGWWHEVTRRIRQNGEDPNAQDPIDGVSLLHVASQDGRRRLVEELLHRGAAADVRDRKGRTPLHCCAEHGSESVAATLVHVGGVGVNVNDQDDTGASALSIAARLGHVRLVRWLCSLAELKPCEPDRYGVAALHKAVSFGQLGCVEALLTDRRVRACIDQPVGQPTVTQPT